MDVLLADTVLPSSHLEAKDKCVRSAAGRWALISFRRYGFRVEAPSPELLRWQAAYDEKQGKHKLLWDKCGAA